MYSHINVLSRFTTVSPSLIASPPLPVTLSAAVGERRQLTPILRTGGDVPSASKVGPLPGITAASFAGYFEVDAAAHAELFFWYCIFSFLFFLYLVQTLPVAKLSSGSSFHEHSFFFFSCTCEFIFGIIR